MNEWINNVVHRYSGILLRHKRKEVGSFVVMWMNLESVIQNEVGQKEKQISYFNAYMHGVAKTMGSRGHKSGT